MNKKSLKSAAGFTIVELMIALSVLSVLLVAASTVIIQVGSLYTKGVNSANLQNANRDIVADLSSAIQFSGSAPVACVAQPPPAVPAACPRTAGGEQIYAFCINNIRYSYILGREEGFDSFPSPGVTTNHVLWRDILSNNEGCTPLDISQPGTPLGSSPDGFDMVPNHMRLVSFSVTTNSSGLYVIDVGMAFGDSDLVNNTNNTCNGGTGTQYCANSDIQTTVEMRVN